MEDAVPVILFALGFGAALLARRASFWVKKGKGGGGLPMDKGAVRLDQLAKKRKSGRP